MNKINNLLIFLLSKSGNFTKFVSYPQHIFCCFFFLNVCLYINSCNLVFFILDYIEIE